MKRVLSILLLFVIITHGGWSQQRFSPPDNITAFPIKFIGKVNDKSQASDEQMERQTIKCLQRLARKEQALKRKLACTDSAAAKALFGHAALQYKQLIQKVSGNTLAIPGYIHALKKYLPFIDSVLAFLQQGSEPWGNNKKGEDKLRRSLQQWTTLQSKLQQAEYIKALIRQRKEQVKQTLYRYAKLPKNITRQFRHFNKHIYYYTQQVNEYRRLLNNPDGLAQKALCLLNRFTAFNLFIQKHGELAGLFGMPGIYNVQGLAGLQNRQQVQQLIQTQLSLAGPDAQQLWQQHIQAAQEQLSQLKHKLDKPGGIAGDDFDLPVNFKPNNQKTKSFWKRLEYGTDFQSVKSNSFFPTTTDIGLSVGYKLNDRSVIGIGASYKAGWGKDIRHINITHRGASLRLFTDIQLKGDFYFGVGYEQNFQPFIMVPANSPSIPLVAGGRGEAFQHSGLIGLSKVMSLNSKLFKKTKLQLLWDFLSYRQTPRTQSLNFRINYNY